jgi:hypothetical protein
MLLAREGALTEDRFYENISELDHAEREWFGSLIEAEGEGDLITASAFGSLVLPAVTAPAADVLLSPQAVKALEKADGVPYGQFVHMLNRVGDRMGAIVKGDRVYVAELWQQHEHEDAAATCRISDYHLDAFVKWADYANQQRIEDVPERPAADEIERLAAENKVLRVQLRALHTQQGQATARQREEASLRKAQQQQRREKKKRGSRQPPKLGPMAEKLATLRTPPKTPDQ